MKDSSETPRSTYQAPLVTEIGAIDEVKERRVWELGAEPAPIDKPTD